MPRLPHIIKRFQRRLHPTPLTAYTAIAAVAVLLLLGACSGARRVPQGSYLLDRATVTSDSAGVDVSDLSLYLRQHPNHKMLWSMKLRLGVYNMAGTDTTKWWNRWIRSLGEPPVIYDSTLTYMSARQLEKVLENRGWLHPKVSVTEKGDSAKRKMRVEYRVDPGVRYTISDITYEIEDSLINDIISGDTTRLFIKPGDPLNRADLDLQRDVIMQKLRNRGYFNFRKEYITFTADTTEGSSEAELTMRVQLPSAEAGKRNSGVFEKYIIRNVYCLTDFNPQTVGRDSTAVRDTVGYKGLTIIYGDRRYLRPSVLRENIFLESGQPFSQRRVDRTYQALSRLEILKFVNVRFEQAGAIGNDGELGMVDAYVLLTPGKTQSFSVEIEGTNSEGDLGLALGIGYSHNNIGRGSETLTAKLRGAYESISGNLDGLLHNRYMEYSLDVGLRFPKFKAPFLRESFKRTVNASTEINLSMNYQERPEYTRIISTAGWSYKWNRRNGTTRHSFTPIDINYVYLPESTNDFINSIAPDNPLLRYSYEDHFIMRMGYTFFLTNKRTPLPWQRTPQKDIYTVRASAEIAGNLLYAISNIFAHRDNAREDPYKVFGIRYSQYFKIDSDFSYTHLFDRRQSVACRAGLGVGYPYGNSTILPFEKRFYGGGANGVRGWDVRSLGPGCYPGTNSVSDFMNQCGDIRFILSGEYRLKLFWIVELGAFIDIGNIWTIKDYSNQPGGLFRFRNFAKELAASYGLGIRLDFNYFLLRFDLGMKAHNPALGEEPWPLIHPKWGRDRSFHFSIGYPF